MTSLDVFMRIRRQNVTWREVDGIIIALDLSSSTYFTTNRTGRLLWNAMIEGAKEAELIALLQSSFGLSGESATADIRAFVQLLEANNLLERTEKAQEPQLRGDGSSS